MMQKVTVARDLRKKTMSLSSRTIDNVGNQKSLSINFGALLRTLSRRTVSLRKCDFQTTEQYIKRDLTRVRHEHCQDSHCNEYMEKDQEKNLN